MMSNIDHCYGCKWVFAPEEQSSCWGCENQSHYEPWKTKNTPKPLTNADYIRSMSDEELADFFWGFNYKDYSLEDGVALTKRQLLKWLKQPKENAELGEHSKSSESKKFPKREAKR